jgi:hypothetical protein
LNDHPKPRLLTRAELAHGRKLLDEAFDGPWRYKQFEIECGVCEGTVDGQEDCTNPECTGAGGGVPATFVEAPEAYPGESEEYLAQVVATIDVPGLSCLAEKNGEAICWLRNEAAALLDAHEKLLDLKEALEFIAEWERANSGSVTARGGSVIEYAKSLGWTGVDDA